MNIDIRDVTKRFPGVSVFSSFSLSLRSGEICCLLGPSGCGKTTLLHLLAGSIRPEEGEVTPDTIGRVSYLFQESRLLPWMTSIENVGYLMSERISHAERERRARLLLQRVHLEGFENHYPAQLSGGMARRVALARMLGKEADLLLLDEPFSSLDGALRDQMVDLSREVLQEVGRTVLCVTHDVRVAERIGDRVVTLARTTDHTEIATDRIISRD